MSKTIESEKVKNKSVGVIIFLSGGDEPTAILLRRGNVESAGGVYKKESYPGICQSAHVKLTPEEVNIGVSGFQKALERGFEKELGLAIFKFLKTSGQLTSITPLSTLNCGDKIVVTLGAVMPAKTFHKLVRTPYGTRKIPVSPRKLRDIEIINPLDKDSLIDENIIVMFQDEFDALKKGFETLFKK